MIVDYCFLRNRKYKEDYLRGALCINSEEQWPAEPTMQFLQEISQTLIENVKRPKIPISLQETEKWELLGFVPVLDLEWHRNHDKKHLKLERNYTCTLEEIEKERIRIEIMRRKRKRKWEYNNKLRSQQKEREESINV